MPKITIKEWDRTKAGVGAYANFTVVVPGLVAEGKWKDEAGNEHSYGYDENDEPVFDENGVYECSSKANFEKYIGKVAADEVITVKAERPMRAPWSIIENDDSSSDDSSSDDSSEEDPDNPRWISPEEFVAAKLASEVVTLCTAVPNSKQDIGLMHDESWIYAIASDEYDDEADYALLYLDRYGRDEERSSQYGNQIAYELLGMGYTVLYKKFEADDAFALARASFWEPLKDKATYDFRYVINGLLTGNTDANNAIIELAHFDNKSPENTGRGDCTALVDLDATSYQNKSQSEALSLMRSAISEIRASKYAAIVAPYVIYGNVAKEEAYGYNNLFPAAFHYLACAARAGETFNEWYAVAGYTRGISNYSVIGTGIKLGEAAIDALEPRAPKDGIDKAVNLIVKIRGNYYLWGNRTAEALEEDLRASHFLNIRQLCSTIKKQVYVACRRFTFDPNSDILWINFCNAIRPTLEKMKADQGIKDYKFIKVRTSQKAVLKAKIRIVPIEAVEDFDISLYLEDSLGGVTVEDDEE